MLRPGSHPTPTARAIFAAAALVGAICVASYAPLSSNAFVPFDDDIVIYENPALVSGLSADALQYAFSFQPNTYYQPLAFLSLAADRALFGLDARAYHIENLILHLISATVVLIALAYATGRIVPATAVAALFAVHPVNVEAVAWAAERKTVLATVLGLLAALVYGLWTRRGGARRYLLALMLFAASLLAKPMLLPFPAMLLVLDLWPLERTRDVGWRRLVAEKIPFALLAVASAGFTLSSLSQASRVAQDPNEIDLTLRVANAVVALGRHLLHLAAPFRLSVFYPYPTDVPAAGWMLAGGALIAALVACVRFRTRMPWLLAGFAWFVLGLVPTLGFWQAGLWPALADRHAYIAGLGAFVPVAFGASLLAARQGPRVRRASIAIAVALVLAVAALAHRQVSYWRDGETLFSRGVEIDPRNPVLLHNLGTELQARGDLDGAEQRFRAALDAAPRSAKIHASLSTLYEMTGQPEPSLREAAIALELDPDCVEARFNLGMALVALGQVDEAVPHLLAFLRIAPSVFAVERARAAQMLRVARHRP